MIVARSPKIHTPGLLLRMIGANPAPGVLVAILVFVAGFLGIAAPAAGDAVYTAGLRIEVNDRTPVIYRDVVAQALGSPEAGPSAGDPAFANGADTVWGRQNDALRSIVAGTPEPLRTVLGEPESSAMSDPTAVEKPSGASWPASAIALGADPRMTDRIRMVSGQLPDLAQANDLTARPIEFILSTRAAASLQWPVGEVRSLIYTDGQTQPVRLSGTFEPLDRAADTWRHSNLALSPSVDQQTGSPVLSAEGYVNAASWPVVSAMPVTTRSQLWFPVRPGALTHENAEDVKTQSRALLAQTRQLTSEPLPASDGSLQSGRNPTVSVVRFTTRLPDAIETAQLRNSATTQLLGMIVAGPAGLLLAVFVLNTQLWATARRETFELVRARGASAVQLRSTGLLEALLFALPGGLLAWVAASLIVPGSGGVRTLLSAASICLLPALLFACLAPMGANVVNNARRLPNSGSRSRVLRVIAEIAVFALTVASFALQEFDVAQDTAIVEPNLLRAVTAFLVALCFATLTLRISPLLVVATLALVRRTNGVASFVGAATLARAGATGLAPLVATVVGLSISLFSLSLMETIDTGINAEADAETGADLSIFSKSLTGSEIETLEAGPGVTAVAEVRTDANARVSVGMANMTMKILVVDSKAVEVVQRKLAAHSVLPPRAPGGSADADTAVPIVASQSAASMLASGKLTIRGHPVIVEATVPDNSAMTTGQTWLMVDSSYADPIIGPSTRLSSVLLSYDGEGPDSGQVKAAREAIGPVATVRVASDIADQYHSNPATEGVSVALVTTAVISLLFSVTAVLISFVLGSKRRQRTSKMLSVLGMPLRGVRRIVAWEVLPLSLVGVVMGVLAGVSTSFLLLSRVNLAPLTGSWVKPVASFPLGLALVCAATFVIAVACITAAGAALSVRKLRRGLGENAVHPHERDRPAP